MRIIFLIGNQPNHKALAQKINQEFDVCNILVEKKNDTPKKRFKNIFKKLYEKLFLSSLNTSWKKLMSQYENQLKFDNSIFNFVLDINSINIQKEINQFQPDLVIVSGTSLIKGKVLSEIEAKIGVINLHTGLSPYIKGGPNCTNWCLALKKFEYIGNTVMWIDEGIDSGNIIYSQRTPFEQKTYSLYEIHITVMDHAHKMVHEVCKTANRTSEKLPNIKQSDLVKGTIYYTKDWSMENKKRAIKNLKLFNFSLNKNSQNIEVLEVDLNK